MIFFVKDDFAVFCKDSKAPFIFVWNCSVNFNISRPTIYFYLDALLYTYCIIGYTERQTTKGRVGVDRWKLT